SPSRPRLLLDPGPVVRTDLARARQLEPWRVEARTREGRADEAVVVADDHGERRADRHLHLETREHETADLEAHQEGAVLLRVDAEHVDSAGDALLRLAPVDERAPLPNGPQHAGCEVETEVLRDLDDDRLLVREDAVRVR